MADPICRWRNATPKTICEIIEQLPKKEMSEDEFRQVMLKSKWGESFNQTVYQLACQTALYYIDDNHIYHPRFSENITKEEAEKYLHHWFHLYYIPNPYTRKGFNNLEKPQYFEKTLFENLQNQNFSNDFSKLLNETFKDEIGELDILKNLINRYSDLLKVEDNEIKIEIKEKQNMEINVDRNDKKSFFDSFTEQTGFVSNHSQIIYYGVPGSGKSHMINKTLSDKIKDEKQRAQQVVRVVFHPEYTNADFVGQILPVMNEGGVDYRFKAGPFSRILKRALKNPGNPYYLIIEEINRGNAAAIFGDLFQLLDRNIDGWSSYPVENLDINSFLRSESDSYNDKSTTSSVKIGAIDFDENTGIRLPPNLSILATMNTSDQNVFTLDNAFQRRWEMKLVENKFDGEESQYQKNAIIEGSSVSWEQFQTEINAEISKVSIENNLSSMVDKRLGCWFVKAVKKENGSFEIKEEDFKNKILKYLWDDAFKFNREVFETAENFEELLKKVNMENPNFGIFKDLNFKGNQNAGSDSATDGNEQN